MRTESILIDRASTHNLKQISLAIPKRAITVVTGLSGSGKSSLAFSTLAAESQRMINMDLSLNQGAINFPTFQPGGWRLTRYTDSGYFDNDLPLREWASGDLDFLLYGKKQKPAHPGPNWHKTAMYEGLVPRITRTFINQNDDKYQHELEQVTQITQCPDCQGARVNAKVRSAKIHGLNIADCSAMNVADLQKSD